MKSLSTLCDPADFRQYVMDAVREIFTNLAPGDELAPVVLVWLHGGQELAIIPVAQLMQTGHTKDLLMAALTQIAAKPECRAIAIVNEVWTAKPKDSEEPPFVPPVERPDRQEAAMIRFEARQEGVECWLAPITRNPDGTRALANFALAPMSEGRMVSPCFPQPLPN